MLTALVRPVSAALAACDLIHLERREIDVAKAMEQHREYAGCLREVGARIVALPALDELPDAVFVEDQAVVVDELAVMTVARSPERRKESATVAAELAKHRALRWLREPALLEGGDVLRAGRRIFVGASSRTNREGIAQLERELGSLGYLVEPVTVRGCMHLKTGCCLLGDGTLLTNPEWIDIAPFKDFRVLSVPPTEPFAANVLAFGETVVMAAGYPATRDLLTREGWKVRVVDISELQKAEAGLTCMSILISG